MVRTFEVRKEKLSQRRIEEGCGHSGAIRACAPRWTAKRKDNGKSLATLRQEDEVAMLVLDAGMVL